MARCDEYSLLLLAGGKSTRMGANKAELLYENKTFLEHMLEKAQQLGLRPREIIKQIERKHIFTHIVWKMRGVYLEVAEESKDFCWLTAQQIHEEAALPTAFRQFWEEVDHV